jgi:hypothetical protein
MIQLVVHKIAGEEENVRRICLDPVQQWIERIRPLAAEMQIAQM